MVRVVIVGGLKQWGGTTGAGGGFAPEGEGVRPGGSYPSRKPVGKVERNVASKRWGLVETEVHHTGRAAVASDHLPVIIGISL
mgnify:CR=1 FL=1